MTLDGTLDTVFSEIFFFIHIEGMTGKGIDSSSMGVERHLTWSSAALARYYGDDRF